MIRSLSSLSLLGAALGLAGNALAQQPPAPPPPSPPPPQVAPPPAQGAAEVSEDEIDTFTTIYVELQETANEYESQMASAESTEDAQALQEQMRNESVEAIESHGWTIDQYNNVAQTVQSDQALLEQALELIAEKS